MRFEKPTIGENFRAKEETVTEKKFENIDEIMEYQIQEIKKRFEKYNEEDIVSHDGSINMKNYITKRNGPYKKEEVKNDNCLKDKKMRQWAIYFYGLENETDETVLERKTREYRQIKKSGNGVKLEKLLFVNLNRILAPDYFVMHSSEYDDLVNGVDLVIVEANTGIVACGFDGVYADRGSDNYKAKTEKMRKQSERYGTKLKYGFSFKDGNILKKQLINLPNFFLNMNYDDVEKLEKGMNYTFGGEQKPSTEELEVFDQLIESLEEQLDAYVKNDKTNLKVKEHLSFFELVIKKAKKNRTDFDVLLDR